MLHHYLQRGITPEYILNMSRTERMFYFASMEKYFEEEQEKINAGMGICPLGASR
ncbi:MAG: hypothetical protein MJB12_13485 [Firmicutes bacterium]|nr:hypothetical protein [Bacillota bacterium]